MATKTEVVEAKEDNWKYRRAMAFSSVGAMLAMMGYLTVFADGDNAVQSMLAQSLPLGIIGVIVTYIGGPIADDWLQLRKTT
jgi:hypothetical protein